MNMSGDDTTKNKRPMDPTKKYVKTLQVMAKSSMKLGLLPV
jgi:hypothetical protein